MGNQDAGLPGHSGPTELARDLSLFDITMIGVGAMIGAGIFVLSGLAAGQAGPALVMAFAFNGYITIFTGMVYAELGSAIPEAGGGYLWVREALGRSQAFLAGWMSWFAHAVAGSLYALGFGAFAHLLLTDYFGLTLIDTITLGGFFLGPEKLFAVFAGVLFTYINYRGAKETGLAGNIVTLVKITVIMVFILFGIGVMLGNPAHSTAKFEPFMPRGFGGVFISMGLTFIAFEGYEIIVQSGEEVVNPRENVPKAVFYSMAIVVTVYMLVAITLIGAVDVTPELFQLAQEGGVAVHGPNLPHLPPSSGDAAIWEVLGYLGELGLAQAADQVLPYGTLVILVAGMFSTLSALNATTFSSTRVSFAMGRDRVLPDVFEDVHPKTRTPWAAAVLSGALIVFMAVALPIESVAAATDVMFLLLFLQVNYAAIVIRNQWGDQLNYGYIMPYFPYVPIIGILTKLSLAVYLFNYSPLAWYGSIVWILVGLVIFLTYSRRRIRKEEREEETKLVTEKRDVAEKPYQVMIPLADPENAEQLVKVGTQIARSHDGEVLLTTVETVPPQTPLAEGRRYIADEREFLEEALKFVPDDVPAHRTVTIGHDVSKSIVNIAQQRGSDLILMGWRGRRKTVSDYILGSTIDTVVENAPCDVAIVKTTGPVKVWNVLVPTAGGPHAKMAEEVAGAFAAAGADVTLLNLAEGSGRHFRKAQKLLEKRKTVMEERGIENVDTAVVVGDDTVEGLLTYAKEHGVDTIILGAAGEGVLQRIVFGDLPETVGEKFDGQVIMTKRHRKFASSMKRALHKWLARKGFLKK